MLIYFYILKNIIYSYDAKLNFQHHYSSLHDPSEIILICWFIINIGNSCAAYFYLFYLFIYLLFYFFYFLEPVILFWGSLINKK